MQLRDSQRAAEDLANELEAEDVYFGRDLTPIGGRARRNKISKLREYYV